MDVYFECIFMGKRILTTHHTAKNGDAIIDEELWLPVHLPLALDRILIACKDHNAIKTDKIAGSFVLKISDLLKMGEKEGGTMYW